MIKNYYRPDTIDEAISLLINPEDYTVPLGGGMVVSKIKDRELSVIDLQNLPFAYSQLENNKFHLGATTKLETLLTVPEIPGDLKTAIEHECSFNLRQQASLAGVLLTSDGRSPTACVFLALNGELDWLPSHTTQSLEEYFESRRKSDALIMEIVFERPVSINYDFVARTPFDQPIIQVASVRWVSGRTRLVVGGWGQAPKVAYDSQNGGNMETGLQMALNQSGDEWASKDYRVDAARQLINRFPVFST